MSATTDLAGVSESQEVAEGLARRWRVLAECRSLLVVLLCLGSWGGMDVALADEPPDHAQPGTAPSIVTTEGQLHFASADGTDVAIRSGSYEVEPVGETRLRLPRLDDRTVVFIQASPSTHEETVASPAALIAAMDEDTTHLVLLMPDQTALDAAGSVGGVRSRAVVQAPQLSSQQIKQVYRSQVFTVTLTSAVPTSGTATLRVIHKRELRSGTGFAAGQVYWYAWSEAFIEVDIPFPGRYKATTEFRYVDVNNPQVQVCARELWVDGQNASLSVPIAGACTTQPPTTDAGTVSLVPGRYTFRWIYFNQVNVLGATVVKQ